MGGTFGQLCLKLRLVALVSVLCLTTAAISVQAHEVTPTIADLTVEGKTLTLDLRMNVEAFLAGIDLDEVRNTNTSEGSARYDVLRAMRAAELRPLVEDFVDDWLKQLRIDVGGVIDLSVVDVRIAAVGLADLPRASHLMLQGTITADAQSVTLFWPDGAGDLVLRQQGVPEPFTGYIEGGQVSQPIPLMGGSTQTAGEVFARYIPIGFDHILPKGLDHILFVLGLFFLSTRLRPLIWQISAFTLAHTVTLAFGALGWVSVPANIVEPLIAASIVYVAVENVLTDGLSRWRPVVIFCFGLLHGLGFASVLEEVGLPANQFFPALFGFNIGVELGQLTVIAIAFLTIGLWFGRKPWYRGRIAIPASIVIALIGAYWFVERVT